MAIRKRITGHKRMVTRDVNEARAWLSRFSKEKPLIVPPEMYRDLSKIKELADMMDRVRQNEPLPRY